MQFTPTRLGMAVLAPVVAFCLALTPAAGASAGGARPGSATEPRTEATTKPGGPTTQIVCGVVYRGRTGKNHLEHNACLAPTRPRYGVNCRGNGCIGCPVWAPLPEQSGSGKAARAARRGEGLTSVPASPCFSPASRS